MKKKHYIFLMIFPVLLMISLTQNLFGSKVPEEFSGTNELIAYINDDDNVETMNYIEEDEIIRISIILKKRNTSNQRTTKAIYNYLISPNVFEDLRGKSGRVEYYHDGQRIRLDEIETISSPYKTNWTCTLY